MGLNEKIGGPLSLEAITWTYKICYVKYAWGKLWRSRRLYCPVLFKMLM